MGYPPAEARAALRLSLGRVSSDEDIANAHDVLPRVIGRLRVGLAHAAGPIASGASEA